MSRTHLSDDVLVDRLVRAFDAEVAEVRASDEPFAPVLRGEADLPAPRGRGWRRPVMAAAAAVTVVGLAVGTVAMWSSDDSDDTPAGNSPPDVEAGDEADVPPATLSPPDGVLAPTTVPDDLTLWAVDWMEIPGGVMFTQQLFQRADGGGLVIEVQPDKGYGGSTSGDPLTVRGLPATSMDAKEFPDTDTALFWSEGAHMTAIYSGLTEAEAVALLDSLAWRSDDRMQGFAPPAGGAFQLRAEAIAGEPGDPVLAGNFVYADELGSVLPGQGRQVSVHTATGTTATWTSASSLQPLLHGEVRSDGGIEAYDPDFGSLTVRWPDGRSVLADANGTPMSRDELRAITDRVAPASDDDILSMEAAVSASVVDATTAITEAVLPSGEVTVRQATGNEIVCVADEGDPMCPGVSDSGLRMSAPAGEPPDEVASSLLIGGTWWVAAVGPDALSVHQMPPTAGHPGQSDQFEGIDPGILEAFAVHDGRVGPVIAGESAATSDGRVAVLVRPDPSLTSVIVRSPDGEPQVLRRPGA